MAIVISLMVGGFFVMVLIAWDKSSSLNVIREPIKPLPPAPRSYKIYLATLAIVILGGQLLGMLPSAMTEPEPILSASELQRHIFGDPSIPVPPRPPPPCIPPKCREI
jgi:hypothetical protein